MGTKLKCRICGDIIEGDKKGHLISCTCGAIHIDETPYYFRIGGDPQNVLVLNNEVFTPLIDQINQDKPEPKRINKIDYYLNIAEEVSKRSTCLKRNYGAIIVKNDEIISTGFNGAPRGINSCLENNKCLRQNSERGKDYANCLSVHAEQNAIISASRRDIIDSTMYLVGTYYNNHEYVDNPSPCSICKRMIINAGIKEVIVRTDKDTYITFNPKLWNEKDIIGGY